MAIKESIETNILALHCLRTHWVYSCEPLVETYVCNHHESAHSFWTQLYLSLFIVSSKKMHPIILWTLMTHHTHIFRSWSGTSSTNSDFSVTQYLLLCDVMWRFRWNKASEKKIWDQFPHDWLFQFWSCNWLINEIM